VAEEVTNRLAKATKELEEKYASGKGGQDSSVDGPTGAAYKDKDAKEQQRRRQAAAAEKAAAKENRHERNSRAMEDDADEDEGDDEDEDLRMLREQRLKQIRNEQREKIENIAKGHGQFREISQDEFLTEVTSSARVICHFYHRDFARCAIMDHHLQKLSQRHIEAKFIKINADRAPFFVDKVRL
jgi:hypothetical protein